MPVPPISTLPPAPQITDAPGVFNQKANDFVAALSTLVTETNATVDEINDAIAGALVQFDGYKGNWEAGTYDKGDVVRNNERFFISLVDSNTQEPPDTNWQELLTAAATSYDNTASGLTATDVQAAIDEVADKEPEIASTAQAQAGTDNETFITPLRMREGFNAGGSAPVFACRAWVNFDGDSAGADIRASGNVSSVTRNSAGDYTVNFTTAMPDANYSVSGSVGENSERNRTIDPGNYSTNSFRFFSVGPNNVATSVKFANVSIFR